MPHNQPLQKLLDSLGVSAEQGLSSGKALQSLEENGPNQLRQKKKRTLLQKFFDQFKDVMILILLAAAAVSFVVACFEQHAEGFFEPLLILVIVILNAIMGVAQESKAEKALDALKSMSAPHARVIRDGEQRVIDAADLVPGDIILLEAGDFVPADARLIESASLKSEESALTGESVPSEKEASAAVEENAPIGDRKNMVFSGCSITYGRATAVVTATGMNTEMGKIANLLDNEQESATPLQLKLAKLGKYLGFVALAACAVVFLVGVFSESMGLLETFMIAVSLAVSAIPEGLPAIVTIVLSIGVQRMVSRNAIIRSLPAVETLGSASVICSDKTGTLTQNKMTLTRAYVDGGEVAAISENNSGSVRRLLKYATLCCDGKVTTDDEGKEVLIGDPTETAIIAATIKNGFGQDALNSQYPRVGEIPIDSDRKMMTTINVIDGKNIAIVKGAFDSIAPRCTSGDIERAATLTNEMSSQALRVIAVACRMLDEIPEELTSENIESDLIFLGLVGMIDPPREEVAEAVAVCRNAGIRPVMITGDHVVTASAIAREIGIMR
ncbi:MAG: HAD-IC family P-type ATPase, partial [Clostridia bacterium]|nr:HAD-IC family P-type ATPase [Clostridia bacterium]